MKNEYYLRKGCIYDRYGVVATLRQVKNLTCSQLEAKLKLREIRLDKKYGYKNGKRN